MEASFQLPFPTGKPVNFTESRGYLEAKEFLRKYRPIFKIHRAREYAGEDFYEENGKQKKIEIYNPSETKVEIILKEDMSPEDILLLAQFLKDAEHLELPNRRYQEQFLKELNDDGLVDDVFTVNHLQSLFDNIAKLVNDHNLYLESLSFYAVSMITNNSTMYNTYLISEDPVNLLEANTPVDATTDPLKEKANESNEAAEADFRTSGNEVNKFESINENQVGKKGISICATGLKSYFALTQYCNYLLNNGTSAEQQRILLRDGIHINSTNTTYKTSANIRAIDLNTVRNPKVFKALSEVTQDEDIALTLSALLSLATD